jgi:hypothetical protein
MRILVAVHTDPRNSKKTLHQYYRRNSWFLNLVYFVSLLLSLLCELYSIHVKRLRISYYASNAQQLGYL